MGSSLNVLPTDLPIYFIFPSYQSFNANWLLQLDLHTSFWETRWPKFLGLFISFLVHQQVTLPISYGENWSHFHKIHCTNDLFGELSTCYTYHHWQIFIGDDRHQQIWSIPPPNPFFVSIKILSPDVVTCVLPFVQFIKRGSHWLQESISTNYTIIFSLASSLT